MFQVVQGILLFPIVEILPVPVVKILQVPVVEILQVPTEEILQELPTRIRPVLIEEMLPAIHLDSVSRVEHLASAVLVASPAFLLGFHYSLTTGPMAERHVKIYT